MSGSLGSEPVCTTLSAPSPFCSCHVSGQQLCTGSWLPLQRAPSLYCPTGSWVRFLSFSLTVDHTEPRAHGSHTHPARRSCLVQPHFRFVFLHFCLCPRLHGRALMLWHVTLKELEQDFLSLSFLSPERIQYVFCPMLCSCREEPPEIRSRSDSTKPEQCLLHTLRHP